MTSNDPASDATVAGLADRTTGLVGWTIAWRATSAVATLALGAFLIRQLPATEYGRYTFVLSVLAESRQQRDIDQDAEYERVATVLSGRQLPYEERSQCKGRDRAGGPPRDRPADQAGCPIREPSDRGIASWIVRRHGLAGL